MPEQLKAHQPPMSIDEQIDNLKDKEDIDAYELSKAYNWAYGDVFDRIHKENPEVDIYVRSPGTEENHNYQIRNNRTSLIISTDEIKLLQSRSGNDKKAQEELWNRILEKIRS